MTTLQQENHTAAGVSTVDPVTFIRTIADPAPQQFIELRLIEAQTGRVLRGHYAPDDRRLSEDLRRARGRFNVYFGVAPRTERGKGDRAHVAGLAALYADIDFKLIPADVARTRLREFPLRPSAIVKTGGGCHPYWRLFEFLGFPQDFDRARSLLRRLCVAISGDMAAAEPVRILRVPGSLNFKYSPPREVRLVHFAPDLGYRAEEFEEALRDVRDEHERRTIEWKEPHPRDPNSTRPGDLFNARASWSELLAPHGWRLAHSCGDAAYWTRPGKRSGISASTNYDGRDILWVFTSSAPPFEPGRGYSKFHAFAALEHHGDFRAAARELTAR